MSGFNVKASKAITKLDARGNMLELSLSRGLRVLLSYGYVVAVQVDHSFYRTNETSLTQTMKRHITRWIEGRESEAVDQRLLEIMAGVADA